MKLSEMNEALERDEIRLKTENVDGVDVNICCYMIATPDLWDTKNAVEARGITFNSDDNCIARPMEKFFNINENKFTQLDKLDFSESVAFDKLDGSMITVVMINDKLFCKSKKTFFSPVAIQAQNCLDCNIDLQNFCRSLLMFGYSPTFEFTSFDLQFQIVIPYTEEKMTFLLARHLVSGEYLDREIAETACGMFNVDYAMGVDGSDINSFIELAKTIEGVEGWVFVISTGQRVKLKTQWYLLRHRITSYTARNIFDLIMSEEIDNLMPVIGLREGATEIVNQIGHMIAHYMKNIELAAEAMNLDWVDKKLTLPEIGKTYSKHPIFPLAIRLHKFMEPDYKEYVIRNYRAEFSTTPLFLGCDPEG